MYGDKNCTSVNTLPNKLSWKHYRKKGKIIDLSLLPPCSSSLRKHTSRAYYLAALWRYANILMQNMDSFSNYCWFADGSIDWIDCPYPSDVTDLFDQKDNAQGDESDQLEEDLGEELEEDDSLDIGDNGDDE